MFHRADRPQTLADLSDYLAPSQICIKPINMVEDLSPDPVAPAVERDSSLATVRASLSPIELISDADGNHDRLGARLLRDCEERDRWEEAQEGRDHVERLSGLLVRVVMPSFRSPD